MGRWGRCEGLRVPFAVGALSGTVLSSSLGLFWPRLMGRWGSVIGLPVALEAFAFFQEAIFLGIYLYDWAGSRRGRIGGRASRSSVLELEGIHSPR